MLTIVNILSTIQLSLIGDVMKKFKNELTEQIRNGIITKGMSMDLFVRAQSKILLILSSENMIDLKTPPSNHLEKLKGERKGQYSIRVNEKYRICFDWVGNEAFNIEFIDYHK
ncbi:MAG: type II toxin-antitoxin system RelE/ParE family toxin [Rickettsiales bacterium]|jgi:proteic killer suppression protein|nr:type II toxin-antitoxin system RelE/ParE family toxin [Rickettsiales bacterium]